ncbi:MAG: LEA type 2 family protein [Treponema sp.]|jgi:LEA14-like dessication related protein|nr:LEA type 2 family protein [Treponema sp.]
MKSFILLLFLSGGLFFSCKTAPEPVATPPVAPPLAVVPAPEPEPALPDARLSFERLEAESLDRFALYYLLTVDNPRPEPLRVELREPHMLINEIYSSPDSSFKITPDLIQQFILNEGETSLAIPLRVELDISGISLDIDEYITRLTLTTVYYYENNAPPPDIVFADAIFPHIRAPEFHVISIAVSQADLINTRLRVEFRVDNPNPFSVDLSAFTYKLYGEGRFWAEGTRAAPLRVPANSSATTQADLSMNFINMSRKLFDDILAMKQVNYQFIGESLVTLPRLNVIEFNHPFHLPFDLNGQSVIIK